MTHSRIEDFKYITFSGGGARGPYGYSGAVSEIIKQPGFSQEQMIGVAGASAGAIAALAFCLGFANDNDISYLLKILDLKKLQGTRSYYTNNSVISCLCQFFSLLLTGGTHTNENMREILGETIHKKTGQRDITFREIQTHFNIDLYIITAIVYRMNGKPVMSPFVFNPYTSGATSVLLALEASTAVPIHYPPVRIKELFAGKYVKDRHGTLHVDPDVLPTTMRIHRLFNHESFLVNDRKKINPRFPQPFISALSEVTNKQFVELRPSCDNPSVLNIRFSNPEESETKIDDVTDYSLLSFFKALFFTIKKFYDLPSESKQTISINTYNISATQFNLSKEKCSLLFEEGKYATKIFFGSTEPRSTPLLTPSNKSAHSFYGRFFSARIFMLGVSGIIGASTPLGWIYGAGLGVIGGYAALTSVGTLSNACKRKL
jgi:hypothetical protein